MHKEITKTKYTKQGQDIPPGQLQWTQKNSFPFADSHRPAPDAVGSQHSSYSVGVFTEFDPLKSIIVGYVDQTSTLTEDLAETGQLDTITKGPYPKQFIQEAQKDLNDLSRKLMEMGIQVLRVGKFDCSQIFDVEGFKTTGFSNFSSRDIPFIYHDSFYEFPTYSISRLNDFKYFEWIQKQLHGNNSKIFESWQPRTKGYRCHIPSLEKSYLDENEFFADAANLVKIGLDIVFFISCSASKGCLKKLRSMMDERYGGKVRVHGAKTHYAGNHVDTVFTVIGPNKQLGKNIVLADRSKSNPTNIPAIFRGKNWVVIQFDDYEKEFQDPRYNFTSDAIAMNFFMINSEMAVISNLQPHLKRVLQFYGIKTVQMRNKHTAQFSGGFHCITNDFKREDVRNFEKILQTPKQELSQQDLAGYFDPDLLKFLQSSGGLDDWDKICNQNGIFPTYLTGHMTEKQKADMEENHSAILASYKKEEPQQKSG